MDVTESDSKRDEEEELADGPPPGWDTILPPLPPPLRSQSPPSTPKPSLPSLPPPPPTETGQMVCGSCRQLLCYPVGKKHVKCSCCQVVNFVLEAHQLGVLKCGNCDDLLMYPYGAPSVRCSSCQFVTEIGPHNKRTPWSMQQGQPTPPHAVH